MSGLKGLEPQRVFHYFEQLSAIPRGSENMNEISLYCLEFAKKHSLKAVRDSSNNVIIYKEASVGYENSDTVILQGHLDMVCQAEEGYDIDFLKDGLDIYAEGDFVKARGTSLGADNGIAVAIILSILESDSLAHPPIEAVFTTDEEIGMFGAFGLDMSVLKGRRMINLDSEEDDTITVSCAGGSDFRVTVPYKRETVGGTEITVTLKGLKGGHSGVEINAGRVNANILAGRLLNYLNKKVDFSIIAINGGDKGNAITLANKIAVCTDNAEEFKNIAEGYLEIIKGEIAEREPDFTYDISIGENGEHSAIVNSVKDNLIFALSCVPNGVIEMSAEIVGLVETSLNLGILSTQEDKIILHHTLRSNKKSAMQYLEDRMAALYSAIPCTVENFGHYPPWEYNPNSTLRELYREVYKNQIGKEPKIEAIHAGLECGIFASAIEGLDCIAIGPSIYDVHTSNEKLSISSTERIYNLITELLEKSK